MAVDTHLDINLDLHPEYRRRRLLGRGGFGEVWEAEAPDGTLVALKFLPYDPGLAAVHELRAVQAIRQLNHPHLVRVDKVWSAPGCLVIAMELADGSLADLLDGYQAELGTALPPEDLCPLLAQAAEALDFLNAPRHLLDGRAVGIQHCDVKPGNLLLFGETVKLSDFGLTSRLASAHQAHRRAGTPEYAAPEVFRGQLSDRADQYSLAVSYCVLRSGRLPFADSPRSLEPRYTRPAPDLSMLPEAERPVVARALAPSPESRWPSCRELVARLAEVTSPCRPHGTTPERGERRGAGRRRPAPGTCCRLLAALGKDTCRATVLDISAGGIRLCLEGAGKSIEPGKVLSLVLTNRARGFGRVTRLRVIHSAPRDGGAFEAGGAFETALDEDALAALAEGPGSAPG